MLFQVYGENALFQWGGLIAVLLVLMLLNWYSIKSKRGAIIMLIAVPASPSAQPAEPNGRCKARRTCI